MAASEKIVRMVDATRSFRGMQVSPALGLDVDGLQHALTTFEGTVDRLRSHEALHNPPPKHSTTFTLAYDRQQHTELAFALQSGDEVLMHNALTSATSGLLSPAGLPTVSVRVQGAPGLLDALSALSVSGPTLAIQRMALRVVAGVLAASGVNRAAALHAVAPALTACLDVRDGKRRVMVYDALCAVALAPEGAAACVSLGFCSHLVRRVREEAPLYAMGGPEGVHRAPLDAALAALERVLAHTQTDAAEEAIAVGAVAALADILRVRGGTRRTLGAALRCLSSLAVVQGGKEALVAEEGSTGVLAHLLDLCAVDDAALIAAAASTLAGALLQDECKRVVMNGPLGLSVFLDALSLRGGGGEEGAEHLSARVPSPRGGGGRVRVAGSHAEVVQAKISACTALASVAAHPRARAALCALSALDKLEDVVAAAGRQAGEEEDWEGGGAGRPPPALLLLLATAAQRAHDTIRWTP